MSDNDFSGSPQLILRHLCPECGSSVSVAAIIAVLVNPNNGNTERITRDMKEAARAKGVQIAILKAGTESEIVPTTN